tara:strand:+ start:55 stop:576 length:522 start_codon:yes stop_codon:yes gene_type:complete
MRKLRLLSLFALIVLFSACGSGEEKSSAKEEETLNENYNKMIQTDLSEYGLNATIYIPDESKGKAEISETSWGSINIEVGENFGLEIIPFGMSIEDKKIELQGDLVYNTEYIEQTENLLVFTKVIKDSDMEPEVHFFYVTKVDGEQVEVKNTKDRTFRKEAVDKMVESAKSLK